MVDGEGGGGELGMSDPRNVMSEDKGEGYGQTTTPIDPVSDGSAQVGPSSTESAVPADTTGETAEVQQPQEMGGGSDADAGAISETGGVAGEGSSWRDDVDPPAASVATVELDVVFDGRSGERIGEAMGVGAAAAPLDQDVDGKEPQGEKKLPAPLPATMSMVASSQHIDGMLDGSVEVDPDFDLGVQEFDGGKGHQDVVNAAGILPATPRSAPLEQQEVQDEFDYDIYVTHEHGKDNEEEKKVLERVWTMIDEMRGHNMPGTERPIRVYTASESENHEDDEWMRAMWSSACVVVAVSQSYVDKVCGRGGVHYICFCLCLYIHICLRSSRQNTTKK